jgi:hypothetical protein
MDALYVERQRSRMPWLWALLGIVVLVLAVVARDVVVSGSAEAGDYVGFAVGGLVLALFLAHFLEVRVEPRTLRIVYFPLVKRSFPLEGLRAAEPRTVRPLREFGGWGIRWSLRGNGWAYTVDGREGVQLEFADGRRVFVGSRRPDELAAAIRHAARQR